MFTSDDSTKQTAPSKQPGPGLVMVYRCDYCRVSKPVHTGRKRIKGALWKCAACQEKSK